MKLPQHPEPVKAGLERFGVYGTRWAAGAVVAVVVLWAAPSHRGPKPPPPPPPGAAVPLQESTTDSVPHVLAALLPSTIPDAPGPNQKRAGDCNPKAAQVEINGGCWVKTETPPPCPEGVQWEHKGRCWLPVAYARPVPTSGELSPGNIAGEAE